MDGAEVHIDVGAELWLFLALRDQGRRLRTVHDGTSSLGHVIESLGVPLPEVGRLIVNGRVAVPAYRPRDGDMVQVQAIRRPQEVPDGPPSFVLDVHLGTLARWLRLVGVDTAYRNDLDDDALVVQANLEHRVLLTKDRGLLRRRRLWLGAYVRGALPDDQFRDVLDRFAPPLAPWSRCTACNGPLSPVGKDEAGPFLQPGTRRSYDTFARCLTCGHLYWRGAHHRRLEAIVHTAIRTVSAGGRHVEGATCPGGRAGGR
ncbi:MAG: hypothetical protein JWN00_6123 [Actinomycetia bacterium]|nr:hypothetical protein [Actinomycetes bacterium]